MTLKPKKLMWYKEQRGQIISGWALTPPEIPATYAGQSAPHHYQDVVFVEEQQKQQIPTMSSKVRRSYNKKPTLIFCFPAKELGKIRTRPKQVKTLH